MMDRDTNILNIINILLKYEEGISDGFIYYTGEDELEERLVQIANEILDVINKPLYDERNNLCHTLNKVKESL
jgi:hypothetical protein